MVCAALFFFAGEVSVSCLNWDLWDFGIFRIREGFWSEYTSRLGEYAANRGLSRITQVSRTPLVKFQTSSVDN